MTNIMCQCHYCQQNFLDRPSYVNRRERRGSLTYCSRRCAGLAKRVNRTTEEEKRLKAEYDKKYRGTDEARMKRRESYYRNHDKIKAKGYEIRATAEWKAKHAEYIKSPKYKAKRRDYDRVHLAQKQFGPYADAVLILRELEAALYTIQPDKYEREKALRRHQRYRREE